MIAFVLSGFMCALQSHREEFFFFVPLFLSLGHLVLSIHIKFPVAREHDVLKTISSFILAVLLSNQERAVQVHVR